MFFQRFVKFTAYVPMRLYCFLRIRGKEHLPKGPCILVANHGSMMDPVLMHAALPMKKISFLCSPKLFQCPSICRKFLRKMGAVPLTNVMEEIEELKKRAAEESSNHLIGFFSQGAISHTQSAFQPGAAILACQTGLPLVPVFIQCAPFFRGGSRICFGKPLPVEKNDALDKGIVTSITGEIRNRVYELSADNVK